MITKLNGFGVSITKVFFDVTDIKNTIKLCQ